MSEKKILCMEMESPCVKCGSMLCSICVAIKRYKSWPTRDQAIEKISHALCTQVHGGCETCEQVAGGNENHCNDYRTYAKAVLNALLEANNDK